MDTYQCTLRQFIHRYSRLLANGDAEDDMRYLPAAHFALTGQDNNRQYLISVLSDRFNFGHTPIIKRDYDSVLGFTKSIPVFTDIYIYPLSSSRDILTDDLHLKVEFLVNNETFLKPREVPNMGFAKVDDRTLIRMLFPGLLEIGRNTALNAEEMRAVFEDGIYPALSEIVPENAPNWPPRYRTAAWRAKNRTGGVQHGTQPFPGPEVGRLGRLIARKLAGAHRWARGMMFMVQLRGVKEAFGHNSNRDMAQLELDRLLQDLDTSSGTWYVDVGLEISERGYAYLWRTDAHTRILETAVGLETGAGRRRASHANWKYSRDIAGHLMDVSGYRLPLKGAYKGPNSVEYIQVYTTDKSLTYHLEGKAHSKSMTGMMALKGNPPAFTTGLFEAFNDAKGRMDVAARVELRVPLRNAVRVFLDVDVDAFRYDLIVLDRELWWQWKSIRAYSAGALMATQNTGPGKCRATVEALQLTAGLVWLVNSINSRPDDGSAARDLMLSILPTTLDPNDGNLMFLPPVGTNLAVPYCPGGAIFLRQLALPPVAPVPRLMGGAQVMGNSAFKHFFGHPVNILVQLIYRTGFAEPVDVSVRIPSRKGETYHHVNQDIPVMEIFQDLQFEGEVAVDDGDDLAPEERIFLDDGDAPLWLTRLWWQFLSDLLQKCGNSHNNGPSHCRLTMDERCSITPDVYQQMNLATTFRQVQWRRVSNKDWMKLFGIFWPDKNHISRAAVQNYRSMKYFTTWKARIAEMRQVEVNRFRNKLWTAFLTLHWIPEAGSDRVWFYDRRSGYSVLPPNREKAIGAAPRIVTKGKLFWDPEPIRRDHEDPEAEAEAEAENARVTMRQIRQWPGRMPPRDMTEYIENLRQEEEESSD